MSQKEAAERDCERADPTRGGGGEGVEVATAAAPNMSITCLRYWQMKSVTLVVLLAVTLGYAAVDGDDLPEAPSTGPEGISTRNGILSIGDDNGRLFSSTTHQVNSSPNVLHKQEVFIRLVEYANITGIRANPSSMLGVVTLIDGGLGHNYVKLGFNSQKHLGYTYRILVYGSLVCDD
uniref:SFRICE_006016 n=1 Tax=Spodoptera frugiperda TaxID=7108 RepID=A0A2H1VN41_SPOFR